MSSRSGPTDGSAQVEEIFRSTVERFEMIRPGDRILAAVSGGGDSVLLLHLLAGHRVRCPFTLQVAHLNHGLRGAEGDADEAFVKDLAGRLALPCATERADLGRRPGEPSSEEERARIARRSFLLRAARASSCGRIALGHTLDDQVETILMWLLRGTARGGLSGMEPVTAEGFIRPLIGVRRARVRERLAALGEEFREDRTNADPSRLRNRIRARLVPLLEAEFPGGVETIAEEAEVLAHEDVWLEAAARALLHEAGGALTADLLAAAPLALARRAARLAAEAGGVDPRSLTRRHVEGILSLGAPSMVGRRIDLPGGIRAERLGGAVVFAARGGPGS